MRTASTTKAAAAYLRHLLEADADYRAVWRRELKGRDYPSRKLVPEAIARAIQVRCLYGQSDSITYGERGPVSIVNRALNGLRMSPRTIDWFATTFGMLPTHAKTLRQIYEGDDTHLDDRIPPVVIGLEAEGRSAARPLQYEVRAVVERHDVNSRGMPTRHSTYELLQSMQDDLSYYPYVFDDRKVAITAVRGASAGERVRYSKTLIRVDCIFPHPVNFGEMVSFEHVTRWIDPDDPDPAFYRRCERPVQNLDIAIQFSRRKRPTSVSWVRMEFDGSAPRKVAVALDEQFAVHCLHEYVAGATVGFEWSFA